MTTTTAPNVLSDLDLKNLDKDALAQKMKDFMQLLTDPSTPLGGFFSMITKMFAVDIEPKDMAQTLSDRIISDVQGGRFSYQVGAEDIANNIKIIINEYEAEGRMTFNSPEAKGAFLQELEGIVQKSIDGISIDSAEFSAGMADIITEYNVDMTPRIQALEHETLAHAKPVVVDRMEQKNGEFVAMSPDGKELFTLDQNTLAFAMRMEEGGAALDEVGAISQDNLWETMTDGFTVELVTETKPDPNNPEKDPKPEGVGYRIVSNDGQTSFYIGPSTIPEKDVKEDFQKQRKLEAEKPAESKPENGVAPTLKGVEKPPADPNPNAAPPPP